MALEKVLAEKVADLVNLKYGANLSSKEIQIQKTLASFEGDLTVVIFPLLKFSKMNPIQTGQDIGDELVKSLEDVESFNVVKGFLNVVLSNDNWGSTLNAIASNVSFGLLKKSRVQNVMVEYSSPNTNKPLHLGHIRNNFLGYSVAEILKASGHNLSLIHI